MGVQNYSFGHDVWKSIKQTTTVAVPGVLAALAFLSTCTELNAISIGGGLTAAFMVNTIYRYLKNNFVVKE